MKLVIGNKNYSSWSLRPWLLLKAFGLEFEELVVSLAAEGRRQRLQQFSPSCRVPVLVDANINLWDSLAICEYISEQHLGGRGWPEDPLLRAQARVICAEMHGGFMALRNELPMNCRANRRVDLSPEAVAEIARIDTIWSCYTEANDFLGPWLFGGFSIADCFFAPVVLRFKGYGIAPSDRSQAYADRLLQHESMREWLVSAETETEILPENERE